MAAPTTQNEVTVRRLSTLITGVWDKVKTLVSDKAPLASPALTGTPTAPTAAAGTDTTQIATTAFVKQAVVDGLSTGDAMVYKGTIAGGSTGSYGALTGAASKGWTYKVTTAGKIDGVAVEVGDMLICNSDNTEAATSSNYSTVAAKWDFVQANIDGAVIGPASVTSGRVAAFDGTTGKLIKDSGYTIAKSVPSDAKFTDTTYTFDGTYNASTNKAATVSTVTNAIGALDVSNISGFGAGKTLSALSETDGKISATFQNISITKSQVSDFPTSMTPTSHASSGTGYGAGTTSNYGHVKLATGDMNGASGEDGVACGKNHTHSQYQSTLPTSGTPSTTYAINISGSANTANSLISAYVNKSSQTTKRWKKVATSEKFTGYRGASICFLYNHSGYINELGLDSIVSVSIHAGSGGSLSRARIDTYSYRPESETQLVRIGSTNQYEVWVRVPTSDTNMNATVLHSFGTWTINTDTSQTGQLTDDEFTTYKASNPAVGTAYNYNIAKASKSGVGSSGTPVYINSDGVVTACTASDMTAGSALKAAQDQNGNVIDTTYLPVTKIGMEALNSRLKSDMALSASYANFDSWDSQSSTTWVQFIVHTVITITNKSGTAMKIAVRCQQNDATITQEREIQMNKDGVATVSFALNLIGNTIYEQIKVLDGGGSAPKVDIHSSCIRFKIAR